MPVDKVPSTGVAVVLAKASIGTSGVVPVHMVELSPKEVSA